MACLRVARALARTPGVPHHPEKGAGASDLFSGVPSEALWRAPLFAGTVEPGFCQALWDAPLAASVRLTVIYMIAAWCLARKAWGQ